MTHPFDRIGAERPDAPISRRTALCAVVATGLGGGTAGIVHAGVTSQALGEEGGGGGHRRGRGGSGRGGGSVRVSAGAMRAMKSSLANAVRAYDAEVSRMQSLEDQLSSKIDGLKSECSKNTDQIKSLEKQLAANTKVRGVRDSKITRRRIADLKTETQLMWRGIWGEIQKKNRISYRKTMARKKRDHAETVLRKVQRGMPVSVSTMNRITRDAGSLGGKKSY